MEDAQPSPPELVFSESCPYCRIAARVVGKLDYKGTLVLTPIESYRGESLIEEHHGEFVYAPHLFTEEMVYYGPLPVLAALLRHSTPCVRLE